MKAMQTLNKQKITITQNITADLLKSFIEFIDVRPTTAAGYTKAIKQFFKFITNRQIAQPNRENVIEFRDYLKTYCKAGTIQTYLIAVKLFFKWTAQAGIYQNIAEHIKGAKTNREYKKDYLTSLQAKAVLSGIDRSTLKGKRDYAILTLMTTGGLRTIEVIRANFEDLRTAADSEVLYIQGKGRDEKTEYIKITPQVSEAIRDYINMRETKPESVKPLFESISNHDKGQRMTTRSISRIVKNRLLAVGYNSDRLTAHSLRHTAITLSLLAGASIQEAQQLARHSNINTTMIYSHNIERANNRCEALIANAIFA
jgi:integrase/recombinase XerC